MSDIPPGRKTSATGSDRERSETDELFKYDEDPTDYMSDESFPGSDPPSSGDFDMGPAVDAKEDERDEGPGR